MFLKFIRGLLAMVLGVSLLPALASPASAVEEDFISNYRNLIQDIRNGVARDGAHTTGASSAQTEPRELGDGMVVVSLRDITPDYAPEVRLVINRTNTYVQGYYLPAQNRYYRFPNSSTDDINALPAGTNPQVSTLNFGESYPDMGSSRLTRAIPGSSDRRPINISWPGLQQAIATLGATQPDSLRSDNLGEPLTVVIVALVEAARNRHIEDLLIETFRTWDSLDASTIAVFVNNWATMSDIYAQRSETNNLYFEYTYYDAGRLVTQFVNRVWLAAWLALLARPNVRSMPMCSDDPSLPPSPECAQPTPGTSVANAPAASTRAAYSYIADTQDEFGTGIGVPRSYTGGFFGPGTKFGTEGYQSSFTYDNAVTVIALTKGARRDLTRAVRLGNSLLYAQDHDPENDGRIRASYLPNPFITTLGRDYPAGTPYIGGWSVYTGNMAWAGMAFCHLYKATGDGRYLDGALRAANWIQTNSADDRGAGGYIGGYADTSTAEDGSGMVKRTWKATEHNIDVGAFFSMLNQLTGDQVWKARSDNAFAFVKTMLSADRNHLWTGTGLDGVTTNEDAVPEDVQTWSYLATLDPAYERTVDWAAGRMAATDGPVDPGTNEKLFKGVSFGAMDTTKVWFEGTAHLLAAYHVRNKTGDAASAAVLQKTLENAQTSAPNNDGRAIVAASDDGLDTGQGDLYYASRHTGATAWYLLAGVGANPFRL
ncbi:ribosome-inactivating family protein [Streptomyces vietnamensis]|uniref:ribosome-inactivating family protein n=1 Tax=Streptomyces vietnamensis TaxID=362257 RepID=UPI0006981EE8|nr:ribosome-inactivating family protein [Streptomyces vietnamensis]